MPEQQPPPKSTSTESPAQTTESAETAENPTGLDRLRRSLMRPTRGQAVAAVLVGVLGFAAVTQVRLTTDGDDYANLRESELIQALNGLQAASRLNPLRYVVDAERALFAGSFDAGLVVSGFVAAGLVCAVGLWVGMRSMRAAE